MKSYTPQFQGNPYRLYGTASKSITRFSYFLVALILIALFVQNFLFSAHIGIVGFRDIDDLAFQQVIRRIHLLIQNGNYADTLSANDYAYGWIYWALMALVTFPVYLLSTYFHVDWPLIVIPRQLSLLFGVMSLVMLRKVFKNLNPDIPEWLCAIGLLIFSLYPAFGYFSLRFGTVNCVMFFSILSFYYITREHPLTLASRVLAFQALAIAGAIKLSGLLIAPLIILFLFQRSHENSIIQAVRKLALPCLLFILTLTVFTNPALFFPPFDGEAAAGYWKTLHHFIGVTKIQTGPSNPIERYYLGIYQTPMNALAMLLLSIGFVVCWLANRRDRRDISGIVLTIIFASCYLMFSVKNVTSVGAYYTAVSFLILTSIGGWSYIRYARYLLLSIAILLLTDVGFRARNQYMANSTEPYPWNHLSYFIKNEKTNSEMRNSKKIEECMDLYAENGWSGHIFHDYTVSLTINTLSHPRVCFSTAWNDLSAEGKYCPRPIDFLVLNMKSLGSLPDQKFDKVLQETDPKVGEKLIRDRLSRRGLYRTGRFNDQHFKLICQYGDVRVYKTDN